MTDREALVGRLRRVKTIYSHKTCYDGTGAAMICVRAFSAVGLEPEVQFVQYDTEKLDGLEAGPGQLFVDITPPRGRWEEWKDHDPIVLDHHETSQHIVEGLGGVFGKEPFCGASLAYAHVMEPLVVGTPPDFRTEAFCDLPEPDWVIPKKELALWTEFARLCGLGDTWQDEHEDFPKARAMMRCLGHHGSKSLIAACKDGTLDMSKTFELAKKLHDNAMWKSRLYARSSYVEDFESGGETFKIGFFNCSEKLASDACHVLLNDHGCDVAFSYFMKMDEGTMEMHVSVRTKKERSGARIGARAIAEKFDGGGHWPAAGFKLPDAAELSLADLVRKARSAIREIREG